MIFKAKNLFSNNANLESVSLSLYGLFTLKGFIQHEILLKNYDIVFEILIFQESRE